MRPIKRHWVAATMLVLTVGTLSSCSLRPDPATNVTAVLFDVSASTNDQAIRDRYQTTFDMVLNSMDGINDKGGVLGADIIDDNPQAHGELPVNQRFKSCTVLDNSLTCKQALSTERNQAIKDVGAILARRSAGTDIVGGLDLAQQFLQAYGSADTKNVVILSDMVQTARGYRFGRVTDWSDTEIQKLIGEMGKVDLHGVHVYVVGAGATTPGSLPPSSIDGMGRFWRAYLQACGSVLPVFP